jgi:hypothetical protein
MRMSAMGQKRTCTRFKFGIYGRVCGAIAISFNRGSNEECHAVSCFRAAHIFHGQSPQRAHPCARLRLSNVQGCITSLRFAAATGNAIAGGQLDGCRLCISGTAHETGVAILHDGGPEFLRL